MDILIILFVLFTICICFLEIFFRHIVHSKQCKNYKPDRTMRSFWSLQRHRPKVYLCKNRVACKSKCDAK